MTWDELGDDTKVWSLDASRMKNSKPHSITLSSAARSILREMREMSGGDGFVFESPMYPGQRIGGSASARRTERPSPRCVVT